MNNPEKAPIADKKAEFLKGIKRIGRVVAAAFILRAQNYWMTDADRKNALKDFGFGIDADGNVFELGDGQPVNVSEEVEELKKSL